MPRRKAIAIGRPVRDSDLEGILRRTGYQPSQIRNPGAQIRKPRAPVDALQRKPRKGKPRARVYF